MLGKNTNSLLYVIKLEIFIEVELTSVSTLDLLSIFFIKFNQKSKEDIKASLKCEVQMAKISQSAARWYLV